MKKSIKKVLPFFGLMLSGFLLVSCGSNNISETHSNNNSSLDNEEIKEASTKLNFELNPDEKSYFVKGIGEETSNQIRIPEEYNHLPVTKIGYGAFERSSLQRITIPNSVKEIGSYAFSNCHSLTNVTIPSSVTIIREGAFNDCVTLASINIPNGVKEIGSFAFKKCSLTSITIPSTVTSIGVAAFEECYKLVEVVNNSKLNIKVGSENNGCIGYFAKQVIDDESKSKLTINNDGIVTYNDTLLVNYVGTKQEIVIPDNVTKINNYAFFNCYSLTDVKMSDNVTNIGEGAFYSCISLRNVILSNKITNINKATFFNCKSLINVTIPNGVTSIQERAFGWCEALTSITLPNTLRSIEQDAFFDCRRLVEVINKSGLNITTGANDYGYIGFFAKQIIKDEAESKLKTDKNGFVTYEGLQDIWLVNYVGNDSEIVIPNNITKIRICAFYDCTTLTNVVIPNSVTSIESCAFEDCRSLTSITIPNSVIEIGKYAFEDCNLLKDVYYLGTEQEWDAIYFSSSEDKKLPVHFEN